MPKEGEGHERHDREKPPTQGYVPGQGTNKNSDKALNDLGIGEGGRDRADKSRDAGRGGGGAGGGDRHGGPPDRGDIRH